MDDPRPIFTIALLQKEVKEKLIELLTSYKNCFAWDYNELLGLDRDLVEHCLPIKLNFKPYQ